MVDVSGKSVTTRVAVASGTLRMRAETAEQIRTGEAAKGDVLGVARLAGIGATKWTSHLIPLCHAIPIESVSIEFDWMDEPLLQACQTLRCRTTVKTSAKTGVEMEALCAASLSLLTVYDMLKSIDREMQINAVQLEEKSGGKSGHFQRV